jgi:hypothetical protein
MKVIEKDFESNANQLGTQHFHQIKSGVNPKGKTVYLYQRTRSNGRTFGFEVFIPGVTKAGTSQTFPNGTVQTFDEDTENYAGKSAFGRSAYFCVNMERAEMRFNELMGIDAAVESTPPMGDGVEIEETTPLSPHRGRGRPRNGPRPSLLIPVGEFSVREMAESNQVEYITASNFLKELLTAASVKFIREERRSERGPMTKIFAKTS